MTLTFTVTEADTAEALGSGSLPVLGTPRLLAWCEAATCAAIEEWLSPGETSVGTRVELEHTRASRVGVRVEVTATPYAAASAPDDLKPMTMRIVAMASAQFTWGTYTCPISIDDVCAMSRRGA